MPEKYYRETTCEGCNKIIKKYEGHHPNSEKKVFELDDYIYINEMYDCHKKSKRKGFLFDITKSFFCSMDCLQKHLFNKMTGGKNE